jgi:hypothetical protein
MAMPSGSIRCLGLSALSTICCPVAGTLLAFAGPAQAQPACGWNYGAQITPENSYVLGCSIPDASGEYGTVLRMDPFTPGGVRAESASPAPLPVFAPGGARGGL